MYNKDSLLVLQHAVVLQALRDIRTPKLRATYWYNAMRGLKLYAPYYNMTVDEMVQCALKSGFIKPFTDEELHEYFGVEIEKKEGIENVKEN